MPKTYLIFSEDQILLFDDEGKRQLPNEKQLNEAELQHHFPLTLLHDTPYDVGILKSKEEKEHLKFVPLKEAYGELGESLFLLAGRAKQLLEWRLNHQFCGRCATPTEFFDQGRAKKCPACGQTNYPKISPCIMAAITRGDEILLARSAYFRKDMYSILAGFVEPAETLEACVHREVFEEVGLKIKNLRYAASQPWPFPNLLMIGFLAEYESGEIKIDPSEILEARWFPKKALPPVLPIPISLAYRLIQQATSD